MHNILYEEKDLSWDILDMDRTHAIIICDEKIFESETDHQDCLMRFMADFVREQGWNLDNEQDHAKAIEYTDTAFQEGSLHGFDVYSNCFESYFISHYPQALEDEKVYEIVERYARENDMKIGSFQSRDKLGNEVRLLKI